MSQIFKPKPRMHAEAGETDGKRVSKAIFKYDPVCPHCSKKISGSKAESSKSKVCSDCILKELGFNLEKDKVFLNMMRIIKKDLSLLRKSYEDGDPLPDWAEAYLSKRMLENI